MHPLSEYVDSDFWGFPSGLAHRDAVESAISCGETTNLVSLAKNHREAEYLNALESVVDRSGVKSLDVADYILRQELWTLTVERRLKILFDFISIQSQFFDRVKLGDLTENCSFQLWGANEEEGSEAK